MLPGTTKEQMKDLYRPQGWLTASLCAVPLSINLLVCGFSETTYKCVCAAGFYIVRINIPLSKTMQFLCDIHVFVLPIIIILYIPALRALSVGVCRKLGQSLCRRRHNVDELGP
ncbi:unnamed protein product [Dibothriocephalus latus]|uniref:Uncharacterized protein n=1 Tax=Dibothriocephalus latus TaxID=60516 RepID=A0A3P6R1J8_DIBLA|nr:unnamed protein product [Dibothriocephalus latus]